MQDWSGRTRRGRGREEGKSCARKWVRCMVEIRRAEEEEEYYKSIF